ncbi:MAG: hypothetical protein AMXMBFR84_39090 [Candidatus Hydrogenedentota bacterium]
MGREGNWPVQYLFETLSHAVSGMWMVAMLAAFTWGVLSILLSPCHLASIPLIVGFIGGQGHISPKRAFVISVLFSLGILLTIAVIGVVTALAGRMLGDIGSIGYYLVAVVFLLVGLHLVGVLPFSFAGADGSVVRRKGLIAAFLLGLLFGLALGPCTFAYMAPMLAITFQMASTNLAYGVALLFVYGIGHCSVIVFAGTFTRVVQRYLNWSEQSKGAIRLKQVCGILILAAGVYLIYAAP